MKTLYNIKTTKFYKDIKQLCKSKNFNFSDITFNFQGLVNCKGFEIENENFILTLEPKHYNEYCKKFKIRLEIKPFYYRECAEIYPKIDNPLCFYGSCKTEFFNKFNNMRKFVLNSIKGIVENE